MVNEFLFLYAVYGPENPVEAFSGPGISQGRIGRWGNFSRLFYDAVVRFTLSSPSRSASMTSTCSCLLVLMTRPT